MTIPSQAHGEGPFHIDEDFGGPYRGEAVGGVGDIQGTAPGSAARYNTGKPALDLIPLELIAEYLTFSGGLPAQIEEPCDRIRALNSLLFLGLWQRTGQRELLLRALLALGDQWDECAHVFDFGRKKYSEWNWARGFQWSVPLACAARHLRKVVVEGEALDGDSGKHHFGHVYCNVVMLLTFERTYPEGDNRPRMLDREWAKVVLEGPAA